MRGSPRFYFGITSVSNLHGDEEIKRQTSVRFLGVLFYENLQWTSQIKLIKSKVSKSVGILYKSHRFLNKNTLRMLYFAFIHPYVTYANIVWASTSYLSLKSIFSKQKQACKLILKNKNMHTSNICIMKELNILNIYEINVLQNLLLMSKWHANKLPQSFKKLFSKPKHHFHTRTSKLSLAIPKYKTKRRSFALSCRAPKIWNSFPELHELPSYNFKSAVAKTSSLRLIKHF